MKIQTQVDRDTRPDNIERDSFSSMVDERRVSNISGLKTAERSQRVKMTSAPSYGGKGNRRKRKKRAKAAEIRETKSENEKAKSNNPESSLQISVDTSVNTAADSTSGSAAGGTVSMKLPPRCGNVKEDKQKPKREKYTSAKMDSDGSAAIEMVQAVQAAGNVAVQAGGILRTAVKGGANGLGGIKTFVRRGVNVGSIKDVGHIATAVNTTVANAAKDTRQQMLRTKIDKSTITDTGTETIKQGLTELRYADNVRKAAVNTAHGISKLKFTPPKSKHVNQRLIRKNSKKAAKKAAANMRKMIFSKAGLIVLGVAAALLVLILLVNAVVTIICSAISSLFSWLFPPPNNSGNSKTETEMLYDYRTAVVEYIDDKQQEINDIVDGFVCDKRSYSPYSEITSLNQFGNKKITTEDYNEILAILAVKKYRQMDGDSDNMDAMELNFTDAEIAEMVERFYTFEYSYSYGQREANDIYGMTAADTLKAAQSLYEKKLITYPRTDSNYLSDDMKTLVESIVKCLSEYDEQRVTALLENGLNIDKRVIDNGKISDHHAIIPTNLIGRLGVTLLNDNEKNVAELVINRFLCALDKPYRYTETRYEFSVEGEIFKLTVKRAEEWGWKWYKKVCDTDNEDVQPNISYSENDTFAADNITVKPCEIQPPKRFTESTLLAVMENIDRLIPDKDLKGFVKERGLGTPATRASIIEELIAAGYVQRKKKQLVSTEYGRAFAASLPESVKSAELTAHWEQSLSDIENGNGSAADLLAEIEKTVNSIITIERGRENRVRVTRKKSLGNCPRCGQPVVENSKGFSCSAGREKCGFFIWGQDKRIGRKYTAAEISELLSSGRVTLKNCVSSKGNRYSAVFEMEDTGQYVNLKLVEFVDGKKRG